jgi:hypothetical protein
MTDLPPPLVPVDVDLRDFAFMPLDVVRLRDSDIAALATGDEFRAAVMLWCASWHQEPAASLPNDEIVLSRLAGYGRVVKEWRTVRQGALRGWVLCSDNRLYHPVIAEKANEAWRSKQRHAWSKECDRLRKENKRRSENSQTQLGIPTLEEWISAGSGGEFRKNPAIVPTEHPNNSGGNDNCSDGNPAENALKGQGQGQGEDNRDASHPPRTRSTASDDGWPVDCFDQWYRIFPKHVGKADALRSFERLRKSRQVTWPDLLDATEQFAHKIRRNPPEDPKFIPHPATWLNKGRWSDEPDPPTSLFAAPRQGNRPHDRASALNAAFDDLEHRHAGASDPRSAGRGSDVLLEDFGRGPLSDRRGEFR